MSATKFELTGKVTHGNILHLKEMGFGNGKIPSATLLCPYCDNTFVANSSNLAVEAISQEYDLGPVNCQAKIFCYDTEKNLGKLTLYVRLHSKDENVHNVSISSNSLQLCRFLKAKPANEWHPIYSNKTTIDIKNWKFDLEIALVTDNLTAAPPLLNSVFEDDNTTDVELVGVDGSVPTQVRAHGCMMAAASPFLRAAFYGDFAEARVKRVKVPDANVAALKLIKKYAYTGFVDAEPAMLVSLLPLASRFLMTSLARACAASLYDLPPDDLIPLLQIDLKPTSNEENEDPVPPPPKKPKK